MRKVIATGIQDFEKLRSKDCFYIDKTDFIRKWWNSGDPNHLHLRSCIPGSIN